MVQPIHIERLRILTAGLRTVPPETFHYNRVTQGHHLERMFTHPKDCGGSTACAHGWAPQFFPDDLEWVEGMVLPKKASPDDDWVDRWMKAKLFLAGDEETWDRLFMPGPTEEGHSGLPESATANEVADHIDKWCDEWETPQ